MKAPIHGPGEGSLGSRLAGTTCPPDERLGTARCIGDGVPKRPRGATTLRVLLGATDLAEGAAGAIAGGDDQVVVAEYDGASTPAGCVEPRAQFREVFIAVHDVALDGLPGATVIAAIVERNPAPAKVAWFGILTRPFWLTASHTEKTSLPLCVWMVCVKDESGHGDRVKTED